jgi:hypothetical protein
MREKITKRRVEAIEPSVRDAFLWDSEIPGFGCKVTPKGGRIYLLQYSQGGRDHRVTIGRHGVEFSALTRIRSPAPHRQSRGNSLFV